MWGVASDEAGCFVGHDVRAFINERRWDVREREADADIPEPALERAALAEAVLVLHEHSVIRE